LILHLLLAASKSRSAPSLLCASLSHIRWFLVNKLTVRPSPCFRICPPSFDSRYGSFPVHTASSPWSTMRQQTVIRTLPRRQPFSTLTESLVSKARGFTNACPSPSLTPGCICVPNSTLYI
jgi:hypothetical protein